MLKKSDFIRAFGSTRQAAIKIGTSRRTIYKWQEKGEIPETCPRSCRTGTDWHGIIRKLGFDPKTLREL